MVVEQLGIPDITAQRIDGAMTRHIHYLETLAPLQCVRNETISLGRLSMR